MYLMHYVYTIAIYTPYTSGVQGAEPPARG